MNGYFYFCHEYNYMQELKKKKLIKKSVILTLSTWILTQSKGLVPINLPKF